MGRIPNSLKEKEMEKEQSDHAQNNSTSNLSAQPLKKRLLLKYKLLKSSLQTASNYEVPACTCSNSFIYDDIEFTVIRHFLLNAHEKSMANMHEKLTRARYLMAIGVKELQHNDFTLEDLWIGACEDIKLNSRCLALLARELPELKYFNNKQLSDFVRSKFCDYFVVSFS
jgi:uncharacterized protein YueI